MWRLVISLQHTCLLPTGCGQRQKLHVFKSLCTVHKHFINIKRSLSTIQMSLHLFRPHMMIPAPCWRTKLTLFKNYSHFSTSIFVLKPNSNSDRAKTQRKGVDLKIKVGSLLFFPRIFFFFFDPMALC